MPMSFDFDELIGSIVSSAILVLFILCLCYSCPCCLWYKRRNQGTVYHTVDQQIVNTQSANPGPNTVQGAYPIQPGLSAFTTHSYYPAMTQAAYPVTQQIVVSTGVIQPTPYAVPQPNAYPVSQAMPGGYVVPGAAPPSVPLPPTAAMPMPMGQPPPYSEVMQMQGAAGGENPPEAYTKQAPFNPYFNQQ